MNKRRFDWDFDYHAPDEEKVRAHELVRVEVRTLAYRLDDLVPDCREKSVAITKLEEVMFWINAAIARSPRPEDST